MEWLIPLQVFFHSSCKTILAWIVTDMVNPSGSNIREESCSISRFVRKGILLVMFLGESESMSEEVL